MKQKSHNLGLEYSKDYHFSSPMEKLDKAKTRLRKERIMTQESNSFSEFTNVSPAGKYSCNDEEFKCKPLAFKTELSRKII